jgi:hypothetical protein
MARGFEESDRVREVWSSLGGTFNDMDARTGSPTAGQRQIDSSNPIIVAGIGVSLGCIFGRGAG